MRLNIQDFYPVNTCPPEETTAILVFRRGIDLKVLPARYTSIGWRCARTGAAPCWHPIGWTAVPPPQIG